MDDPVSALAAGRQVAARLREQSARLKAVADAAGAVSYEARAAAGGHDEVAVTATGQGQVSRIRIGPRAMRSGSAALGASLSRLINQAVRGARERAAQAMRDAADPGLRAALSDAPAPPGDAVERFTARLSGQVMTANSPDGIVTVTVSGIGDVLAVRIAAGLGGSGGDPDGLGEQVAAAANDALGAARRLQQRVLDAQHDDEQTAAAALDARLTVFNRQMDELLGQFDQADRRIADLE